MGYCLARGWVLGVISEAQRRAILADFVDPIHARALDHELADYHGVTPREVRELRREHRRDLGIGRLGAKLAVIAERTGWPGTLGELLEAAVDALDARMAATGYRHPDERMQALREALTEERRRRDMEGAVERARSRAEAAADVDGGSSAVPHTGAPGSGAGRAAVDRVTPEPAGTSSSLVSGNEKSVSTATVKRGPSSGRVPAAARRSGPWVQPRESLPTRPLVRQRSLSGS